ncbi:hypothetical protein NIES4071_109270 (plasmid) [Calothrix sp. NIES-4071]|nr:hypothetical protein NIES4071_109270 [Calothrix sp. NIES-4071]BAZ65190.1 hypothetical protein NIES4105_109230 [Calothrix sp. NIES-4105]
MKFLSITIILVLSFQPTTLAQIPQFPKITINPPTPIITVKGSSNGSRKRFKNKIRRIPFTNYAYPTIKINNDTYVIYSNGIRSNRIRSR